MLGCRNNEVLSLSHQSYFVSDYDPTIEDSYTKICTVDGVPARLDSEDGRGNGGGKGGRAEGSWGWLAGLSSPWRPFSLSLQSWTLLARRSLVPCGNSTCVQATASCWCLPLMTGRGESDGMGGEGRGCRQRAAGWTSGFICSFNEVGKLFTQILRVKDRDDFPIVLVGNKADLETQRQVWDPPYPRPRPHRSLGCSF